MTRHSCPTNSGRDLQERSYVCGATDGECPIVYTQDCCIGRSISFFCIIVLCSLIMIFESCKVWCSHLQITFLTHFMWHVPLLFMYFWTRLFWMLRFSKDVRRACRPFLQTSSPGFSLFRNGPGDTLGDASGLHLCQLLALCLSPAKVSPRLDPSLLVITVGIHG